MLAPRKANRFLLNVWGEKVMRDDNFADKSETKGYPEARGFWFKNQQWCASSFYGKFQYNQITSEKL